MPKQSKPFVPPKVDFILVPDDAVTGLWCKGTWVAISPSGKIGATDQKGYTMSPDHKNSLIKHAEAALVVAQQTVVDLAKGLERLRVAPTKVWPKD